MSVKLFVGGLSFTTSNDSLRAAFARYGVVESAAVMTDRETGTLAGLRLRRDGDDRGSRARARAASTAPTSTAATIRVDKATPRGSGPRPGGFGGPRPGGGGGYAPRPAGGTAAAAVAEASRRVQRAAGASVIGDPRAAVAAAASAVAAGGRRRRRPASWRRVAFGTKAARQSPRAGWAGRPGSRSGTGWRSAASTRRPEEDGPTRRGGGGRGRLGTDGDYKFGR